MPRRRGMGGQGPWGGTTTSSRIGGRRTTRYSKYHTTFLFTVKPFASAESPFAHLGAEWAGEPKRNEGAEWHQIGNVWPLYRRSFADYIPPELRSFEALAALLSIAPSPEPHPWSTGSMIPLRMACDFLAVHVGDRLTLGIPNDKPTWNMFNAPR